MRFEIEAKSDPTARAPSPDPVLLARSIGAVVRHGLASRSRLRSFDWRVLVASRRLSSELPTVALVRVDTATSGSSWMRFAPFRHGRWAVAVTSAASDIGAVAVAPADALVDREFVTSSTSARAASPLTIPEWCERWWLPPRRLSGRRGPAGSRCRAPSGAGRDAPGRPPTSRAASAHGQPRSGDHRHVLVPDAIEQLASSECPAGVPRQEVKQPEFLRAQVR